MEEGKARMGEGGRDEEVGSKKKPIEDKPCKNRYPIYDQNGGKMPKIDTQFMTKRAEKPFGAAHTYIAHIRKYPHPPGKRSGIL